MSAIADRVNVSSFDLTVQYVYTHAYCKYELQNPCIRISGPAWKHGRWYVQPADAVLQAGEDARYALGGCTVIKQMSDVRVHADIRQVNAPEA